MEHGSVVVMAVAVSRVLKLARVYCLVSTQKWLGVQSHCISVLSNHFFIAEDLLARLRVLFAKLLLQENWRLRFESDYPHLCSYFGVSLVCVRVRILTNIL